VACCGYRVRRQSQHSRRWEGIEIPFEGLCNGHIVPMSALRSGIGMVFLSLYPGQRPKIAQIRNEDTGAWFHSRIRYRSREQPRVPRAKALTE